MGEASIYVFLSVLALPRAVAKPRIKLGIGLGGAALALGAHRVVFSSLL
jgi:hypothetical protein